MCDYINGKPSQKQESKTYSDDSSNSDEEVRMMNTSGPIGLVSWYDTLANKLVQEFEEQHKEIPMCWPRNKTLFLRICQIDGKDEFLTKKLQVSSLFNPEWGHPHCFICHPKYKYIIRYSQLRFLINYLAIPDDWVWCCKIKVKKEEQRKERLLLVTQGENPRRPPY